MIKTACFVGGVAVGFAVGAAMSEEQRRQVLGRARGVTSSPTAQRLSEAAHVATDAVVERAVSTADDAAAAVADVVRPKDGGDVSGG